MERNSNKHSDEENRKYNGQTVVSVLSQLGDAATADKICNEIGYMINKPLEVVEPEVKRILRRGISNGFLVKFGKNYLLSGAANVAEVDSKPRRYENPSRRANKRKRISKPTVEISDQEEEEEEVEGEEGDYFSIQRKIEFKFDQTDSAEKDDQLVVLNPRETVNSIVKDLYQQVKESEDTSDEQNYVIDLEDIISRNINRLGQPTYATSNID